MEINKERIIEAHRRLRYPILPNQVNMFGVRTNIQIGDTFNDYLGLIYGDTFIITSGTTEPGAYWISNPMNNLGTAILRPKLHTNIWSKGYHNGYKALVQTGIAGIWRYDYRSGFPTYTYETKGNINIPIAIDPKGERLKRYDTLGNGINFHRAKEGVLIKQIGKWSAGCQVVQDSAMYDNMINVIYSSKQQAYNYALFTESEILF